MNDDRLYIIMRRDLDSLNPGKAVAQGAHAATMFLSAAQNNAKYEYGRVVKWLGKRGFGTKICLAAGGPRPGNKDESWILEAVVKQAKEAGHLAGLVKDPTYPLRDGSVTHLIPVITCAYVFGGAQELKPILGNMSLMP